MNKQVESEKPKNSKQSSFKYLSIHDRIQGDPAPVKKDFELFRTELNIATTREEHHENIKKLVKTYAKRKKITVLFTLYDERYDVTQVRHKYTSIESSSHPNTEKDTEEK
jgi:hypothetical protein